MKLYLGIDPDKNGAVAFYDGERARIICTPTLAMAGTRKEINESLLVQWVRDAINRWSASIQVLHTIEPFALIEQQQAQIAVPTKQINPKTHKPVMQTVSTGDALLCYGIWRGILAALDIPRQDLRAVAWKKLMIQGLPKGKTPKERKEQSILMAHRLFPNVSLRRTDRCRTDDDGMADALLLAACARRIDLGGAT